MDTAVLTEYGVAGFAVASIVAVARWFLGALKNKDALIGDIVKNNEQHRARTDERHDASYNRLSDAIIELTKEIARTKS